MRVVKTIVVKRMNMAASYEAGSSRVMLEIGVKSGCTGSGV